jgi:hypothetical protein
MPDQYNELIRKDILYENVQSGKVDFSSQAMKVAVDRALGLESPNSACVDQVCSLVIKNIHTVRTFLFNCRCLFVYLCFFACEG